MREIQYKSFSLAAHKKNLQFNRANVCQLELTFRCTLHCRHCYTDCYNRSTYFKNELNIKEIKLILDKLHKAGVIWLCFTGGDPLARMDFLEIYSYAKEKGFIITVFTNAYSVTEEIIKCFKERPPFVIEITLNAVREDLYEKISQVKGSFLKVMEGINLILKEKIPLKIKTQVTKDNFSELPKIRQYLNRLGLKFLPSHILYPRLNGDKTPCNLRISPREILGLNGNDKRLSVCDDWLLQESENRELTTENRQLKTNLFPCAVGGGDGFYIDPYGNAFLCNLIRRPKFSLLEVGIEYAMNRLLPRVREKKFLTDSRCRNCNLKQICCWCPGRAYLEEGDMEAPIEHYCELAKLASIIEKSKRCIKHR